jgi:aspartate aminotransferase-like enzyme
MSLGNGLGPLADRVFRIGHLGDFHDLMVTGTLSGVEMGLRRAASRTAAAASRPRCVCSGQQRAGGHRRR